MPNVTISSDLLKARFSVQELSSMDPALAAQVYSKDELIQALALSTAGQAPKVRVIRPKASYISVTEEKGYHGNTRAYNITDPDGNQTRCMGYAGMISYLDGNDTFLSLFPTMRRAGSKTWDELEDHYKGMYLRESRHKLAEIGFTVEHCTTF